jgi:hypothetical protein
MKPYLKNKLNQKGVAQVEESLKAQSLTLNPSTTKKKENIDNEVNFFMYSMAR